MNVIHYLNLSSIILLASLFQLNILLQPSIKKWNKHTSNRLRKLKSKAWTEFKTTRNCHGRHSPLTYARWHSFVQSNKNIKAFKNASRCSYELELVSNIKTKPKMFHSYLRSHKTNRPTVGPLKINNTVVDDEATMAEDFVSAFASVLTPHLPPLPHMHQHCDSSFSSIPLSPSIVAKAISALNENGSMGPDLIHPLLKRCKSAISLPLYLLFNKSLTSASVPSSWKVSNIVPIFKKGSPSDPFNYRPISLTSVCSKTLERIVVSSINDYLDTHHILSIHQFGFRSGRSAQDQLLLTYNYITDQYDLGRVVDLILFDFRKAFDLVPHSILLDKLRSLGFASPLLDWIGDFLLDREMKVVISGVSSSARRVESGVPQGSVIGPLLFNLFINHILHDLNSQAKLFADDLKIYRSSLRCLPDYLDSMSILQSDISLLQERASSWGLSFASQKCVHLHFVRPFFDNPDPITLYLDGSPIQLQSSARDLGVEIDINLKFHSHIRTVANKAYGVSNNLLRGTICRTPEFMKSIFIAHIRPIIDYCSPIWNTGYIGDMILLESVQRRWTKLVDGLTELSYYDRLQSLSLFSIWGRLLRADLILVWKSLNNKSKSLTGLFTLSHNSRTRGHPFKLPTLRSNTDIRRRFFTNRVTTVWNNLSSATVMSSSIEIFKSNLPKDLGDLLYFYYD